MATAKQAEPVPIKADETGVLRVGNTRVLLDLVVHAFNAGSTPEEIVLAYDTLRLEDVYLVIGYYLRHRAELDAYLAERQREADAYQAEAEARFPYAKLRAKLLARREGR